MHIMEYLTSDGSCGLAATWVSVSKPINLIALMRSDDTQ